MLMVYVLTGIVITIYPYTFINGTGATRDCPNGKGVTVQDMDVGV